jgi:hypothetical protein
VVNGTAAEGKPMQWSHPLVVMMIGFVLTGSVAVGGILLEIGRTLDRMDQLEESILVNRSAIVTQVEAAIAHSDSLDAQMSTVMSDRMNAISNRVDQRISYADKQFDKFIDTMADLDRQLSSTQVAYARLEGLLRQERSDDNRR